MTILKLVLSALSLFKMAAQWFRDRSIHDAGRKAERSQVKESERNAQDKMDKVKPVAPDDVVSRLRKHEF